MELLLVLAVLCLVIAIALPNLPQRSEAVVLRAAAESIANALRGARGLAIHRNAPTLFTLDVDARRWAVEEGESGTLSRDITLSLVTGRRHLQSSAVGSIQFFPDGSASGGQVLLRGKGQELTVTVDWLTGEVSQDG